MTQILAARGTLAAHRCPQSEITAAFSDIIGATGATKRLLERLHGNAGVEFRHLALPLDDYAKLVDFKQANDIFLTTAVDLGVAALLNALDAAGLRPGDVDLIISSTITGFAVPSLEARIASRLGMRPDVKRVPLVGLGCVAGACGVARLNDYLVGHPQEVAVLVCVELCSLTLQADDTSTANLIASGLFGDGAGAVVAVGADHQFSSPAGPAGGVQPVQPRVLASRSRLYADTERAMGWDVGSTGLRIILGAEVPQLVRDHVGGDVDGFLADQGLTRADIEWWCCHPGGPKVLEAMQDALGVDRDALAITWNSLRQIGNLSSASVLHVLADTLTIRPPRPGSFGILLAMGPGFCLELVLLQA